MQLEVENKLGPSTLSRDVEDLFMIVLNHVCRSKLKNLNTDETNRRALDLGDTTLGIAFQVTAQRGADKINRTLAKLTDDDLKTYPDTNVMIVGKKQSSYALDPIQCARTGFRKSKIWDIATIAKHCRKLTGSELVDLMRAVDDEIQAVRFTIGDGSEDSRRGEQVEQHEEFPSAQVGELRWFADVYERQVGTRDGALSGFRQLCEKLQELPKQSRECLGMIVARREKTMLDREDECGAEYIEIDPNRLKQFMRRDIDDDVQVLVASGLLEKESSWLRPGAFRWRARLAGPLFNHAMLVFLNESDVDVRAALVNIDFTAF